MNTSSLVSRAALVSGIFLVGCSSGSSTPSTTANVQDASQDDGGGVPEASSTEEGGGGGDAGSTSDASTLPNADAGPISAPDNQWTWVPFGDSKCRDGSTTGIGVNVSSTSKKLMIFLEGGGACFNATTCGTNPSSFDSASFDAWKGSRGNAGVFNRADAANAMKDWSFVYVPYCTGDVHSGNNPGTKVPGLSSPQEFVGYANMGLFLQRLVPTFTGLDQVLLTGESAGGFGATGNYEQVAKAFGSVPVDLIDDSGPLMADPYLAQCMQDQLRTLWKLDQTFVAACGADCADPKNYLAAYSKHLAKTYPQRRFGLVDSDGDVTISQFFGFGASNCTGFTPLQPATYQSGLIDAREQLSQYSNVGSFLFSGGQHTSFGSSAYDTRTSGTTKLTDWVAQLVSGTVTNVGP